jgi:ABC-type uncharacterized transport system permease subunit
VNLSFLVTAGLYLGAAGFFLFHLWDRKDRILSLARGVLAGALTMHLGLIGLYCLHHLNPLQDIRGALSLSAWLIGVGYLLTTLRSRLAVIGIFLAPVSFVLFVSSRLTPSTFQLASAPKTAHLLGELHIALSTVGVAIFGIAAAVAMLYLFQEAALKSRHVMALVRRWPSLTSLDEAGHKLILVGFPIFTLSVISGLIWTTRLPIKEGLRLEHVISALTWIIFAALIAARVKIGLRGRRAALLTLLGFSSLVTVLLVYMSRRVLGG